MAASKLTIASNKAITATRERGLFTRDPNISWLTAPSGMLMRVAPGLRERLGFLGAAVPHGEWKSRVEKARRHDGAHLAES